MVVGFLILYEVWDSGLPCGYPSPVLFSEKGRFGKGRVGRNQYSKGGYSHPKSKREGGLTMESIKTRL